MFSFPWWLSLGVGFLSLSQEILWVRLVSFAMHGSTYAFAVVLLPFLAGIAMGAAVGKRWCEVRPDLYRVSAVALGTSAFIDLTLVLLLPMLRTFPIALATLCVLIFVSAALKSVMFPIAHHQGSQQGGPQLGRSVSKIYFGNIIGSALGPIVTGYLLLDILTLETCLLLLGVGTATIALMCAVYDRPALVLKTGASLAVVALLSLWLGHTGVMPQVAVNLGLANLSGGTVSHMVQNRHGIIHTLSRPGHPDAIMGGNNYDGMLSVNLQANENGLDRAVVLLAVHPRPERVLVIGMSGGAWTRILAASAEVREIVVIEINPGYLDMVRLYPQVAPVLSDPRVKIVIDDGRRWLRQHPNEKFDLIVQNTTYHWRAYSTNLLSREYMQLISQHLRPGGIVGINSTMSSDVLKTAEGVFAHVERRGSFVYGSDRAFSATRADADAVLRGLTLDHRPVFVATDFNGGGLAAELIWQPFITPAARYEGMRFTPSTITDANLLVEQVHGAWPLHKYFPRLFAWIDRARGISHPSIE